MWESDAEDVGVPQGASLRMWESSPQGASLISLWVVEWESSPQGAGESAGLRMWESSPQGASLRMWESSLASLRSESSPNFPQGACNRRKGASEIVRSIV